jgi:hypothetical protein
MVHAAERPIVARIPDLEISIQCSAESDVIGLLCEEGDRELQRRANPGEPLPEPSRLDDVPSALGNAANRTSCELPPGLSQQFLSRSRQFLSRCVARRRDGLRFS